MDFARNSSEDSNSPPRVKRSETRRTGATTKRPWCRTGVLLAAMTLITAGRVRPNGNPMVTQR